MTTPQYSNYQFPCHLIPGTSQINEQTYQFQPVYEQTDLNLKQESLNETSDIMIVEEQ